MISDNFQECILGGDLNVEKEGIQRETAKFYFIVEKVTPNSQRSEQTKLLNFQLLRIVEGALAPRKEENMGPLRHKVVIQRILEGQSQEAQSLLKILLCLMMLSSVSNRGLY